MGALAGPAVASVPGVAARSADPGRRTSGEEDELVVVVVVSGVFSPAPAAVSSASRARRRAARLLSSVSSVIRGISPVSSETLTPLPPSSARRCRRPLGAAASDCSAPMRLSSSATVIC